MKFKIDYAWPFYKFLSILMVFWMFQVNQLWSTKVKLNFIVHCKPFIVLSIFGLFLQINCAQGITLLPKLSTNGTFIKIPINPGFECIDIVCNRASLSLEIPGKTHMKILLIKNSNLFPDQNLDHCHYIASSDSKLITGSISWCNSTANGLLHSGESIMFIHYNTHLKRHFLLTSSNYHELSLNRLPRQDFESLRMSIWEGETFINGFAGLPNDPIPGPLFVKLVIVNDNDIYRLYNEDSRLLVQKNQEIANIVNSLYRPLNVIVVLMDSIIWTQRNEIKYTTDPLVTLQRFQEYRVRHLLPRYENYTTQLLTNISFGLTFGYSMIGSICNRRDAAGINTFWGETVGIVATIMAHEIGHSLGMWHDDAGCYCSEPSCIMRSVISLYLPKRWSDCSVRSLKLLLASGFDRCLYKSPFRNMKSFCGNGIIELDEECDCGRFDCGSCCEGLNCKLTPMACCGSGVCCNRQTCRPYRRSDRQICRKARGPCDLPEYCDGLSEFCPPDRTKHDGTRCESGYCFAGLCGSYDSQCELLWGAGTKNSHEFCYQHNINGSIGMDCGYNYLTKTHLKCSEADTRCGRLQCASPLNVTFKFLAGHLTRIYNELAPWIICKALFSNSDTVPRDPGLVPNGAPCRPGSMCVNTHCVSVASVKSVQPCPFSCSGHGICDDRGQCQCYDGFGSQDCSQEIPWNKSLIDQTDDQESIEYLSTCRRQVKASNLRFRSAFYDYQKEITSLEQICRANPKEASCFALRSTDKSEMSWFDLFIFIVTFSLFSFLIGLLWFNFASNEARVERLRFGIRPVSGEVPSRGLINRSRPPFPHENNHDNLNETIF